MPGAGGGPADPIEGYKWLVIAERGGHPESRAIREKTTEQMPDRDRQRADALAQKFSPTLETPVDPAPPRLNPPQKP